MRTFYKMYNVLNSYEKYSKAICYQRIVDPAMNIRVIQLSIPIINRVCGRSLLTVHLILVWGAAQVVWQSRTRSVNRPDTESSRDYQLGLYPFGKKAQLGWVPCVFLSPPTGSCGFFPFVTDNNGSFIIHIAFPLLPSFIVIKYKMYVL